MISDRPEVLQKPLLRAFIVIWSNDEQSIRASLFCILRKLYCISGLIGARTRNDRDAPFDLIYSEFYRGLMLFIRHRSGLPTRARDDDCIRTASNLILNDAAQLSKVDAILCERRDDCNTSACEYYVLHFISPLNCCFYA